MVKNFIVNPLIMQAEPADLKIIFILTKKMSSMWMVMLKPVQDLI